MSSGARRSLRVPGTMLGRHHGSPFKTGKPHLAGQQAALASAEQLKVRQCSVANELSNATDVAPRASGDVHMPRL